MPTTIQLVISGQSKPGVMAQVAQVLGEAGVNIKAFSAPEVTGTGKLRLLVADLDGARAALKAAKIKFVEETALLLSLENKPGAHEGSCRSPHQVQDQYQVRLLYTLPRGQARHCCSHCIQYRESACCPP